MIFGVQTDPLGLLADSIAAAAAVVYVLVARRERRRGRRWSRCRIGCFVVGVFVIWLAAGSGLAAYDDSPELHIVQHVLLMMVAPPLLSLGRPLTLVTRASSGRPALWVARWSRRTLARRATGPAAAAVLYLLSMFIYWLDPAVYRASIEHPLIHQADHLIFLMIGFIYWDSLLGGHPSPSSDGAERIVAALGVMPFEAILGVLMTLRSGPLYRLNSLADSPSAGRLFVVLAMLASGAWLLVIFSQWFGGNLRRERVASAAGVGTSTAGPV